MFLGKYSITLDNTSRFQPPANFARKLSSGFYMTQGFDRNLWVLTPEAFEEVYKKISSLNLADPLARLLVRMILGMMYEIQINQDGTITIPLELKKIARIKRTIFVVGQGDYFEIWEPLNWAKQEIQLNDTKANASRFASLSIVTR